MTPSANAESFVALADSTFWPNVRDALMSTGKRSNVLFTSVLKTKESIHVADVKSFPVWSITVQTKSMQRRSCLTGKNGKL